MEVKENFEVIMTEQLFDQVFMAWMVHQDQVVHDLVLRVMVKRKIYVSSQTKKFRKMWV